MLVRDVIAAVESMADVTKQESWDNTGMQVGHLDREVRRIASCVTVTVEMIESIPGVDMILAHHPLFLPGRWQPVKRLTGAEWNKFKALAQRDITVYSFHSPWDPPPGGTRDILGRILGLQFPELPRYSKLDVVGTVEQQPFETFLPFVERRLQASSKRVIGKPGQLIRRVAALGGSTLRERNSIEEVLHAGCDCIIGGDSNTFTWQLIRDAGATMIDIGHDASETPGIANLLRQLRPKLDGVDMVLYVDDHVVDINKYFAPETTHADR